MDKFNSLFKRLNVYGYRHYHNFGAWMNALLVNSVEAVLLDDLSLNRGIVSASALRQLIADTRRGVSDHGYLLQALLILELWQKQVLD